jgi:hypothetical protein
MDQKEKYYASAEIYNKDAGEISLNNEELRKSLSTALTKAPAYVVDAVFKHCLCLMADPEQWTSFIPNRVIKDKHVLLFPHTLKSWSEEEQARFILHTVAHYILHHWSLVERRPADHDKQELEAEDLAHTWLEKWSEQKDDLDSGG